MPKPWFKVWSNILDKEKIHSLTGDQTKAWLYIMAVAQRADEFGALPPIASLAFQLRSSPEMAQKMIDELQAIGLIEIRRSRYVVHDWKDWQGDGKSDAQRKREQRERDRDMSRDKNVTVTPEVTSDVTDLSQPHAGAEIKTKTKRETKTNTTPRKRVVRLPDFNLPEGIPETDWNDWLEMRRAKKTPATIAAMTQAVRELEKLRAAGHDPGAVLRQSTYRGWTGVFPIQAAHANGNSSSAPPPKIVPPPEDPEHEAKIRADLAKRLDY